MLLNMKRSLSVDMTWDTAKILTGASEQTCLPIMATFGQKTEQCLRPIMSDEGGTAKAFEKSIGKHGQRMGANPMGRVHLIAEFIKRDRNPFNFNASHAVRAQ